MLNLTKEHSGNGNFAVILRGTPAEIEGHVIFLFNHGIIDWPEENDGSPNCRVIYVNRAKYIRIRGGWFEEEFVRVNRRYGKAAHKYALKDGEKFAAEEFDSIPKEPSHKEIEEQTAEIFDLSSLSDEEPAGALERLEMAFK